MLNPTCATLFQGSRGPTFSFLQFELLGKPGRGASCKLHAFHVRLDTPSVKAENFRFHPSHILLGNFIHFVPEFNQARLPGVPADL